MASMVLGLVSIVFGFTFFLPLIGLVLVVGVLATTAVTSTTQ